MSNVTVRIPSTLRKYSQGARSVDADGITLREVVADLEQRCPGIAQHILEGDGSLRRFINVYVNDKDIRFLEALSTPVRDGDVIVILPATAGGAPGDDGGHDRPARAACTGVGRA